MYQRISAVEQHERGRRLLAGAGEDEDLVVAGQRVPAGRYRRVDVPWGRVIEIDNGDYLPASLDGRVAIYEKLPALNNSHG